MTAETFRPEIAEALRAYERYVVCLEKTPDQCEEALVSLMEKAIKAYMFGLDYLLLKPAE